MSIKNNLEIIKKNWDYFVFSFWIIFFLKLMIINFGQRVMENSDIPLGMSFYSINPVGALSYVISIFLIHLALVFIISKYAFKYTHKKLYLLLGVSGFFIGIDFVAFMIIRSLKNKYIKNLASLESPQGTPTVNR